MPEWNLVSPVQNIKARAESLGFCLCGITDAEPLSGYSRYEDWLTANHHGRMDYLTSDRHRFQRSDPKNLVPWVKSIIVLAWPYKINNATSVENSGHIAGYVGDVDYHEYIPRSLLVLTDEFPGFFHRDVQSQVFCDSAPILERELAARAGLGWIGKNSNLINPKFGSGFLLAEIFIDQEIPIDLPLPNDLCGNCHKCIDACPVGCILPDRTIDANHCLSSLTIETKGLIPHPQQIAIGNHVFGCDICQAICPWNSHQLEIDNKTNHLSEQEMITSLSLDEASFRAKFRHTVFWRGKREGFLRNLCIVLGNLKSTASQESVTKLIRTETDPIICISAARALMAINPDLASTVITERLVHDKNPIIIQELKSLIK